MNMGLWSCWPILTLSPSELMNVNFSYVLPYLTVDYVLCTFFSIPKFPSRLVGEARTPPRQRRAPVGSIGAHPVALIPTEYVA